ncbi:ribosome biogenesis GTP-binding protein YihA/YsxC [Nitrosovibrio sp. Nv6]|uniref:ribosome biogenesis GTP-binding protein YihA/YsxC n=1 Tax=Nitrosovibrio sp. Nv6 TaxID=1855340 RepID=UPI0008B465FF|nr:ribosome biogenesis GTP-binding protein YihA/YsxC [Nitrosovibrio sp. Nv6]SEO80330.1 GTP-binding protein [Nitrosovibrio sp. Nv6]
MSLFQHAVFYTTVNQIRDLPPPDGVEIAFAGRSNAGKSSAINSLANRGRLAFVSKTPGRTQHLNFFQLGSGRFLVDLPGYGYAKVPFEVRQHWEHLLSTYLQTRESLHGMVLIMDVRHPLTPLDRQMLTWFASTGKPVHVLLTKSDKLARQHAQKVLKDVLAFLRETYPQCSVQLFSSFTREGVEEATALLGKWLEGEGLERNLVPEPNEVLKQNGKVKIKNPRLKGNKTGGKLP